MQFLGHPHPDCLVLRQYYVNLFLPFGLCSSPAILNLYANALEFAMWANNISDLLHYLDDYFMAGPTGSGDCQCNINLIVEVCKEMGFMVNPLKFTALSLVTCFLDINIDSCKGVAHIDPKHLEAITHELSSFSQAKLATKEEIIFPISKLHFVCRVCPLGRVFLCRIIETCKKACYLHHHIKLNADFLDDIEWWLTYLPSWNGVSYLYDVDWTNRPDMELFTNASNKGFGCYFQGQRCQGTFPKQAFKDQQMSINWHKLYAVTMALALCGPQLKGKHLLFHCNNVLVVHIMAKASTHSKTMMALVHTFTLLAMQHNVQVHIHHITGVSNDIADALSCFEMDRFWQLCPHTETDPLPAVNIW